MNVKLIAETRKQPKIEKHYYTSDKCRKCEIDNLKDDFKYLNNVSSVMLIYILILNIALILKNNIFRVDIFSFLYNSIKFVCISSKSIWHFIDKISQIAYKINNIICANIIYWILITILITLILVILSIIGFLFIDLMKKVFKLWDTIQSYIFIIITTFISYISDIFNIKIFNLNLLVIFIILFFVSVMVRIIYSKKTERLIL